jgi:outer membrane protein OmpA-like peptidoglycan-associated protein
MRAHSPTIAAFFLVLGSVGVARADETWLLGGSLGATAPLGSPYDDAFAPGGSLDVGVYRSLAPWILLGGRAGGTVLGEGRGTVQGNARHDAGTYTLARTASILARVRPLAREGEVGRSAGLWIESGGGPGISEGELRPVMEGAIGWGIQGGIVTISPEVRYAHVFEPEGSLGGHDANLLTFGIEGMFLDRATPPEVAPSEPTPRPMTGDADGDGILDQYDRCNGRPETINGINDQDGCPDNAQIGLVGDRIVFDERIFFAFDEAAVTPSGRQRLRDLALLMQRNRWEHVRIEGHADARGSIDYNRELSAERAENVRSTLIEYGCVPAALEVVPRGEADPVITRADTEAEHALNRRVEFVVRPAPPDSRE